MTLCGPPPNNFEPGPSPRRRQPEAQKPRSPEIPFIPSPPLDLVLAPILCLNLHSFHRHPALPHHSNIRLHDHLPPATQRFYLFILSGDPSWNRGIPSAKTGNGPSVACAEDQDQVNRHRLDATHSLLAVTQAHSRTTPRQRLLCLFAFLILRLAIDICPSCLESCR